MRLFHGTKTTNPELIYADKEESFNINYSRATNLLGIGVYFAQQAAYSNGYCHKADGFRSMFLCEVITGDSEKCPMHAGDIRDTSYKDPVNKIKYESMTDYLEGSHIYVVYKSRRAYPLYLIKY